MSQEGQGRVTRFGNSSKSPSRIPVPSSLPRKRPAQLVGGGQHPNVTPKSTPASNVRSVSTASTPSASPSVSGFRRLELLAKAEARNRNQGQSQCQSGSGGSRKTGAVPWVEKHLPKSLDDLFVHKRKVEEVMNWLESTMVSEKNGGSSQKRTRNICVLSGPAGSGKTATISLIGKKLDFDLKEWINPMSLTTFQFRQEESEGYRDDIQGRNQLDLFVDFLFRTSQYRCLAMKGKTEKKHRLIVVEDIPNAFYRDPNDFHNILRKYSTTGRIPLVFVFTDTANGDHSMYKMFPKSLMMDLNICNISFNQVASTLMVKFLLDICTKESMPVEKSMVEEIAAVSNGDLRCAVNNLQFSLTKERVSSSFPSSTFRKPPAKRAKKPDSKGSLIGDVQQKDNTIQLFRAIGKVLYAKRDEGRISECEMALVGDMEPERRIHPLIEDPEGICDRIEVSADTFLGFLHQNYPSFYGSLDEMRTASEYLSLSDFVLNGWKFDDSGGGRSFKVRQVKDFVGLNIAVRGLMHSNNNRVGGSWKPLTKPLVSNMDNFTKENVESTRQTLFHMRELQTTLFTESIPFYAKLLVQKPSAQIDGRKEILEKGLFRAKLIQSSTLDEKETVEESPEMSEEDKELEEQRLDIEKGSNASNAKNTAQDVMADSNDIVGEDEEFQIEDYDD